MYDFYSGTVPGVMDENGIIWSSNKVLPELTLPKDAEKKIKGMGLVTFGTSYLFKLKQFIRDSAERKGCRVITAFIFAYFLLFLVLFITIFAYNRLVSDVEDAREILNGKIEADTEQFVGILENMPDMSKYSRPL